MEKKKRVGFIVQKQTVCGVKSGESCQRSTAWLLLLLFLLLTYRRRRLLLRPPAIRSRVVATGMSMVLSAMYTMVTFRLAVKIKPLDCGQVHIWYADRATPAPKRACSSQITVVYALVSYVSRSLI